MSFKPENFIMGTSYEGTEYDLIMDLVYIYIPFFQILITYTYFFFFKKGDIDVREWTYR
jgi:hypothetical protein